MILCLCTFRGYFPGKVEDFIESRSIFNCSRKSNYLLKDAKGEGREEAAAGITFNTKLLSSCLIEDFRRNRDF